MGVSGAGNGATGPDTGGGHGFATGFDPDPRMDPEGSTGAKAIPQAGGPSGSLLVPWGLNARKRGPAAQTQGEWPHKIPSVGRRLLRLWEIRGGVEWTQAQALQVESEAGPRLLLLFPHPVRQLGQAQ